MSADCKRSQMVLNYSMRALTQCGLNRQVALLFNIRTRCCSAPHSGASSFCKSVQGRIPLRRLACWHFAALGLVTLRGAWGDGPYRRLGWLRFVALRVEALRGV